MAKKQKKQQPDFSKVISHPHMQQMDMEEMDEGEPGDMMQPKKKPPFGGKGKKRSK